MRDVQFGTDGDRPCNIFIVHEAEAQAIKALGDLTNELTVSYEFSLLTEPFKTPGSAGRLSLSWIAEAELLTSVSTMLLPPSLCTLAQKCTKLWVGAQPATSRYVGLQVTGAMVGACDPNDRFRSLVRIILRGEQYLETEGGTIDDIITNELMPTFENTIKRTFKYNNVNASYGFQMRGLRASHYDDRVRKQCLVLK